MKIDLTKYSFGESVFLVLFLRYWKISWNQLRSLFLLNLEKFTEIWKTNFEAFYLITWNRLFVEYDFNALCSIWRIFRNPLMQKTISWNQNTTWFITIDFTEYFGEEKISLISTFTAVCYVWNYLVLLMFKCI